MGRARQKALPAVVPLFEGEVLTKSEGLLTHIPEQIAHRGRVRGWEDVRDVILRSPKEVAQTVAAAIKIALEVDRHALMAAVAESKAKGQKYEEVWDTFQKYLHGEVDLPGVEPEAEEDKEEE